MTLYTQVNILWCLWCYSECASTPGKLITLPDHGGNRTRDLWDTSSMLYQLSYGRTSVPKIAGSIPTVVRQIFQLSRRGCTRKSNTTNTKNHDVTSKIPQMVNIKHHGFLPIYLFWKCLITNNGFYIDSIHGQSLN